MLVLLAYPRRRWCPGEHLLVSYSMIFCMEPQNIFAKTSAPPGRSASVAMLVLNDSTHKVVARHYSCTYAFSFSERMMLVHGNAFSILSPQSEFTTPCV